MPNMVPGEEKAWQLLSEISPEDVCRKALAGFDNRSGSYSLKSFGLTFYLNPAEKSISCREAKGELFLGRLGYFFRLSTLWYLVKATDAVPSGKLVKPSGMTGGDIFFRGSHVLPLDALAKKYARDKETFISTGIKLGGMEVSYGDAALELRPFSKIPVTIILWLEDEEFPSRAELLFDSTALFHLPLDILWSIAMMSVLVFL